MTGEAELLEAIADKSLVSMTRGRLNLRRASVWAAIAYEQVRIGQPPATAARRARAALNAVRAEELSEDHRAEYLDALIRGEARIRWAAASPLPAAGTLVLRAVPGNPGQTCIVLARSGAG